MIFLRIGGGVLCWIWFNVCHEN